MSDCGASDVGLPVIHRTRSPWQVWVNRVDKLTLLVFSGLIPLALLTGFWPWHVPASAVASHLLRTTERTLLSRLSPQRWNTNCTLQSQKKKGRVCRDCYRYNVCWMTAYYGETLRAMEHHCSIPLCVDSAEGCILGNTLPQCHIIFFYLSLSLYLDSWLFFLSITPMHILVSFPNCHFWLLQECW